MPLDQSLSTIIRDLAGLSFDAKVIADRLGISSGQGDITFEATAAGTESVFVPDAIAQLRAKIDELNETVTLLTLAASEKDQGEPMSDQQFSDFIERFDSHLVKLAPIQIEGFYNESYFNQCASHLRAVIAGALTKEFTRRKLVPAELWTTFI